MKKFILSIIALAASLSLSAQTTDVCGVRNWEERTRLSLERMADNLTATLKPWKVPNRVFKVEDYGAVGDGVTLNTEAIQRAIDDCTKQGGGVVMFSSGEYVTGTIHLKSNVMLEITQDVKILGSTDLADYPHCRAMRQTVMDTHMDITQSLIFAEGVENIGLRGPGAIDFRGTKENFPGKETVAKLPGRPFGIRVIDSKNIVVQNINLKDSPSWMQDYLNCESIIIDGVNNFNQTNWNQDGLDIDGCYRVIVRNCFFNVYDDSMCFKGASLRTTEDILVENSTFYSLCNSFKLGTDSQADFRRIVARNLVLGGPAKGLPKQGERTTSSTAVTMTAVDGSDIEDILMYNIEVHNAQCPFFLKVGNRGRLMPGMDKAPIGRIRRCIFENFYGDENGIQGSILTGIEEQSVEDIIFRNIDLVMAGGVKQKALTAEVGEHLDAYPDAFRFNQYIGLPSYGFWFRYTNNVHLYNVNITTAKEDPRPHYGKGPGVEDIFVDGNNLEF